MSGLITEIGPIYTGATHRPFSFTWLDDDGNPLDLTVGGTPTFVLRFKNRMTGVSFQGAGSFQAIDLTLGEFQYTPNISDLVTPGYFLVQVTATWPDGSRERSDEFLLPIQTPL